MDRKKVVILTDVPAYSVGLGSIARIKTLVEYLSGFLDTHCIILGTPPSETPAPIGTAKLHFQPLNADGQIDGDALRNLIATLKPDVGIIEYAYLGIARPLFPKGVPMVLDTLDLLYIRAERFRAAGLEPVIDITEEKEFSILDTFDRVLLISKEELEISVARLGKKKCIFSPHIAPTDVVTPSTEAIGGMLCSGATANRDALDWLHDSVLTESETDAVRIRICGTISRIAEVETRYPRFEFLPPVALQPEFYNTVAFTMNPTRFGGGMKIKSVEAFGYGIPLVTTPEGIDGCPSANYEFCRVATTAEDFRNAVREVAASPDYRAHLREGALRYAREHLSGDAAFGALLRYIRKA